MLRLRCEFRCQFRRLERPAAREVRPIRTHELNSDLTGEGRASGPRRPISLMGFISPKNP